MGYTEQFNLLSPCYKKGEQPAGFHMGGVKAKPAKKGKATKKGTTAKPKKTKSKHKLTKTKSYSLKRKARMDRSKKNKATTML